MNSNNKHKDVDKLLRGLFNENTKLQNFELIELFEQRLADLSITKNQACIILDIEHKTLDSVLDGTSKKIDFLGILKLSYFLDIPHNDFIDKYFDLTFKNNNEDIEIVKKRSFIVKNFDLPQLKKSGFIDSINDFDDIEIRLNQFFGYDTIFEFGKNKFTAALSSGSRKTNQKSFDFWSEAVCKSIDKTPNPHKYDREGLIEFFPRIRAYCLDVEKGLIAVAQKLFTLGVTLIIVPKYNTDLHLRGATFVRNGKPCIALTKYTQFYPTIWFTLIHECYHVLYDWEVIKKETFHFSIEVENQEDQNNSNIINGYEINESEANYFAREYLFSNEKLKSVTPLINDKLFIERFAKENHVHPSFIYSFYLWNNGSKSNYGKFNKYFPKESYDKLLKNFSVYEESKHLPVNELTKNRNNNLNYNTL
ncbi:ImmA/IrrE family metallo-endopeptidase [Winogradskyella tangerina]|uniref:ImmA/IrrE family metallo-endopeptidase n=1 Tax=Winogradskyella tangerina TaxID=2023240 RepID=UPI000DBE42A7|nr:ImmA/IrrE family metallo-endopeptidase [Winogradskyella tangerina]